MDSDVLTIKERQKEQNIKEMTEMYKIVKEMSQKKHPKNNDIVPTIWQGLKFSEKVHLKAYNIHVLKIENNKDAIMLFIETGLCLKTEHNNNVLKDRQYSNIELNENSWKQIAADLKQEHEARKKYQKEQDIKEMTEMYEIVKKMLPKKGKKSVEWPGLTFSETSDKQIQKSEGIRIENNKHAIFLDITKGKCMPAKTDTKFIQKYPNEKYADIDLDENSWKEIAIDLKNWHEARKKRNRVGAVVLCLFIALSYTLFRKKFNKSNITMII